MTTPVQNSSPGGDQVIPIRHDEPVDEPLFVIEHLQTNCSPDGRFTPNAQAVVSRNLRTSGLLAQLPDSEARSLLALLSLLTANGRLNVTPSQVAAAIGVVETQAEERLDRLCQIVWQGKPIAFMHLSESGLKTVSLASHVLGSRGRPAMKAALEMALPLHVVAGRNAVIAYSRSCYARPRAEVEREIAAQFGRGADIDRASPAGRLVALGVPPDEARTLEATHSAKEITNQIEWLPYRGAKNPARFVVAAVEGQYDAPAHIRLEHVLSQEDPADLPVGETAVLELPGDDQKESLDE